MPTRLATLLAPALVAAAFATPAFGQETKPLNLSIRIGQFRPSSSVARDEGNEFIAFGAEMRIKDLGVSQSNPGTTTYVTGSVDTYGKGDFRATHLLLNYVTRTNELYFTLGAGAAFTDEKRSTADENRLGYQLGVGYDFQKGRSPLFVEAKWFGTSSNDHLNGFGLMVGIRL